MIATHSQDGREGHREARMEAGETPKTTISSIGTPETSCWRRLAQYRAQHLCDTLCKHRKERGPDRASWRYTHNPGAGCRTPPPGGTEYRTRGYGGPGRAGAPKYGRANTGVRGWGGDGGWHLGRHHSTKRLSMRARAYSGPGCGADGRVRRNPPSNAGPRCRN